MNVKLEAVRDHLANQSDCTDAEIDEREGQDVVVAFLSNKISGGKTFN